MAAATKTAALQYVARAVALILAAFVTALVTRRLGSNFVDWATVINAVALVGVILEPGLTPPVVRRLTQDPSAVPGRQAMLVVRLVLGVVALGVVVGVSMATRGPQIWLLALLLGGQVIGRAIVLHAVPWLQVDQRLHRAAFLEVGTAALGACALGIGVALNAPTPLLGLLAFTGPMFVLSILILRELQRAPSTRRHENGPQTPVVRSVIREALPLAVAIALTAVYTRSSIAFVNAYEDDADTSRFFFAFFLAEQCIVAAGILAAAVMPLMAHRARDGDLRTDQFTRDLLVATSALGAVACGALLAAGSVITRILGGPDLEGAETYIWQLAPLAPVVFLSMMLAYLLMSIGLGYRYVVFSSLGLVANLALNAMFTPSLGADASTRITWATELAAGLIPLVMLLFWTPGGRHTLGLLGVVLGASLCASEVAAAGTWTPLGTGVLLILLAALIGARSAVRLRVWASAA